MPKKILLILMFLVLASAAYASEYAAGLNCYEATFNIIGDKAVVQISAELPGETTGTILFELPEDTKALSLYVDEEPAEPAAENSVLKVYLRKNSKLRFSYVTEEFTDKSNFLINMQLRYDVDDLKVSLVLPEGATLKKPITQGDLTSGSIYPRPDKAGTDGRSLIFEWFAKEVKKGDEISIFAQIEPKKSYMPWIAALAVIIIAAVLGMIYTAKKRPKSRPRIIVKKADMVEKHLKEDEEQIVNVLKQREGSCEQGTLRIVTGFSKATLSRILKELEDRKVVFKEKRGKKNLVFLKK